MVDELEQLLNSLIEKGWQPFREKAKSVEYLYEWNQFYFKNIPWEVSWAFYCTIRELVSKESQLWQFCCKNGMIELWWKEKKWLTPERLRVFNWEYQYRLIESALCNENKLEDFLLSNIKVWNED
jgi:hypothetical protein